jgi:hypothetical protein
LDKEQAFLKQVRDNLLIAIEMAAAEPGSVRIIPLQLRSIK